MAASRRNHGPKVKSRCRERIRQGASVQQICNLLGVSKSYVKRERVEVEKQRKANQSHED
jgi:transposase-like protein